MRDAPPSTPSRSGTPPAETPAPAESPGPRRSIQSGEREHQTTEPTSSRSEESRSHLIFRSLRLHRKHLTACGVDANLLRIFRSWFDHLQRTYEHVSRLKDIFGDIGEKSSGEACEAMKGLIKEGKILLKAEGDPDVRDAGLIGAAQRVEHYEIAGYGTARSLAQRLGDSQVAGTLQLTLNEEAEADKKLTSIAEGQVNISAASGQRR
jgi:ferritin-like metal-binding protein YciE